MGKPTKGDSLAPGGELHLTATGCRGGAGWPPFFSSYTTPHITIGTGLTPQIRRNLPKLDKGVHRMARPGWPAAARS